MATNKTGKVTTTTYLLRAIDSDLWDRVKARATEEGHSLRWIMVELLTWYEKYGHPGGGYARGGTFDTGRVSTGFVTSRRDDDNQQNRPTRQKAARRARATKP